jgi:hypothetical protein
MAVTINASTSAGLVQTADTSGTLQLQTAGTTALTVDASQNATFAGNITTSTGTVTAANFSGNGSGLTSVSASAMTLLGTITPTAVNSISLGSLTLTSYKSLYIVYNNVTAGSKNVYISSTSVQSGGGLLATSGTATSGTLWLDLGTGAVGGGVSDNTIPAIAAYAVGGLTNVTTSSTTIYFRCGSTSNFTAAGSIVIYGVK